MGLYSSSQVASHLAFGPSDSRASIQVVAWLLHLTLPEPSTGDFPPSISSLSLFVSILGI